MRAGEEAKGFLREDAQRYDVSDKRFKINRMKSVKFSMANIKNGKPNLDVALRYRYLTCPYNREKKEDGKGFQFSPYPIYDFEDFEQFGVGIVLYFGFVKKMCWLFLLCGLLTVPALYINNSGSALDDVSSLGLESTTMGNVGSRNPNVTTIYLKFTKSYYSKLDAASFMAAFDLIYSALILVFIMYLIRTEREKAQEADDTTLTVSDYSIRIAHLPPDPEPTIRNDIFVFIERLGYEVNDVVVCYNNGDVLEMLAELGRLHKILESNQHLEAGERDEIKSEIKRLTNHINEWPQEHSLRVVCAYVVLERAEEVEEIISRFNASWWTTGDALRFKGYSLKVEKAGEPSDIIFSNLKFSRRSRFIRRTLTAFATVLVMAVSFSFIFWAMYYQNQIPPEKQCRGETVTKAIAQQNADLVGCYCKGLGATGIWKDRSFCWDYITLFAKAKGLAVGASLVVVLVNFLLRWIVQELVVFEHHQTLTNEQSAVMTKLLLCLFINTSIITVLVNADFSSIGLPSWGKYSEFGPDWYSNVGASIMLTMIVNTVNPQILPFLIYWPWQKYQQWKHTDTILESGTQDELNALYKGDQFLLAERYACVLNTFYSTLLYSAGMPILMWAAFFSFFTTFWFDKITLLRYYATPPQYNQTIARKATGLLAVGVVLHLFLAAYQFGASSIWGWSIVGAVHQNPVAGSSLASIDSSDSSSFLRQFFQRQSFPLFLCAIALIFIRLVYMIKNVCPITVTVKFDWFEEVEYRKKLPRLSVVIDSQLHYIASYRVSRQPLYAQAFAKSDEDRQKFKFLLEPEKDLDRSLLGEGERKNNLVNQMPYHMRADGGMQPMMVGQGEADQKEEHYVGVGQAFRANRAAGLHECEECAASVPATAYCQTCQTELCQFHEENHKRSRATASHTLSQQKQSKIPQLRDLQHPSQIHHIPGRGHQQMAVLVVPNIMRNEANSEQFWENIAHKLEHLPHLFASFNCPNCRSSLRCELLNHPQEYTCPYCSTEFVM